MKKLALALRNIASNYPQTSLTYLTNLSTGEAITCLLNTSSNPTDIAQLLTCPPKTSPGKMLDLGLIRKGVYLWVEGRIHLSRSSIS